MQRALQPVQSWAQEQPDSNAMWAASQLLGSGHSV